MQINRSAAPGPVFPTRVYADVGKAIAWLCKTFGFNVCFHYGPPCNPSGCPANLAGQTVDFLFRKAGSFTIDGQNQSMCLLPNLQFPKILHAQSSFFPTASRQRIWGTTLS